MLVVRELLLNTAINTVEYYKANYFVVPLSSIFNKFIMYLSM